MRATELVSLVEHMEWADARIWSAIDALPPDRAAPSDLRERLFHLHLVQQLYLSMWRAAPVESLPQLADYPDLEAVRRWARPFYPEARAVIGGADERRLEEAIVVPFSERVAQPGRPVTHATFAETVLQVALHTTHHRGQLATRVRELGGEPPTVDLVLWIWTGRPPAEWPGAEALPESSHHPRPTNP